MNKSRRSFTTTADSDETHMERVHPCVSMPTEGIDAPTWECWYECVSLLL